MSSRSLPSLGLMAAAVAAACATPSAWADEFSWQLSGGVRQAETGNFDSDSWAIDATYYVNALDDSAGPVALASFLNPTTRVSAAASSSDSSQSPIDDPTAYTLSGAYVLPGEKWYIGASYAKSDFDDEPFVTRSDPKGYGLLAGRYLSANTTLELRTGRFEQRESLSCPFGAVVCLGLPLEIETKADTVGLEVFHVRRFRALTYTLQGSVSQSDFDYEVRSPFTSTTLPSLSSGSSGTNYAMAAELFPTNRLGVRLGYSRPDGDLDVDGYDVAATWYFKPRVALQFGLSRSTNDDVPSELRHSDSMGVRFIGRL